MSGKKRYVKKLNRYVGTGAWQKLMDSMLLLWKYLTLSLALPPALFVQIIPGAILMWHVWDVYKCNVLNPKGPSQL